MSQPPPLGKIYIAANLLGILLLSGGLYAYTYFSGQQDFWVKLAHDITEGIKKNK